MRAYFPLVVTPFLIGVLSFAVVVFVDPFDVRPTGLEPRVADHRYPDRESPLLRQVLLRQPHDLVLLGSSTMMAVDAPMMREAFPNFQSPINLSYVAPRPIDEAAALADIAGVSGLRKVVLFMDFSLLERRKIMSASGTDVAVLRSTNWHRGGDFSLERAAASLHRLVFGTYDLPSWSRLTAPQFMTGVNPVTNSPATMLRYRLAASRNQGKALQISGLTCGQIPFVQDVLVPFLAKMSKKQVSVDVAFPPLPYILYFDWMENRPPFQILLPGPVFDQISVFKRCVVAAVDRLGSPLNRVVSLDSRDDISGNVENYFDSAHLINRDSYLKVLKDLAAGQEAITPANLDEHLSRLKERVAIAGRAIAISKK